jgi:hypothetical protein
MVQNVKNRKKGDKSVIKPLAVVIAVIAIWAALHQPISFDPISIAVWGCGSGAVGILSYAVLVLIIPGASIVLAYLRRTIQQLNQTGLHREGN